MSERLRLPDRGERSVLVAAAAAWIGAWAGLSGAAAPALGLGLAGLAALVRIRRVRTLVAGGMAGALILGVVGGLAARGAEARILSAGGPEGPVSIVARLASDPEQGRFGHWAHATPLNPLTGRPQGAPVLLQGDLGPDLAVGDIVRVRGAARPSGGHAGGGAFGWRLTVRSIEMAAAPSWLMATANVARNRVAAALSAHRPDPAAALIEGFLIGDERQLPDLDREAMRTAGLSHFTAVSGSNVALFLGALWIVLGPAGLGTRRRAVGGLIGIVVFAAITRWEPSVLRACVMAAIILGSRAAGIAVSPWQALGGAVAGLVIWSAPLASDPGFQLSVAATAGVISGAGFWRRAVIGPAVSTAFAAHIAVVPVLWWRFGEVPVWGPPLNLVAAPLVGLATILGAVATVVPLEVLTTAAVGLARAVLAVAHFGARLPEAGIWTTAALAAAVAAGRFAVIRPAAVALLVVAGVPASSQALPTDTVVFLDIGQGDAALLRTREGHVILVDGGPDPVLLDRKLRAFGIDAVDLVVISHSHRDHIAGLEAVIGRRRVGAVWHSDPPDEAGRLTALLADAAAADVAVAVPPAGTVLTLDDARLEVLGPLRRYASPNDQSLVVRITVAGTSIAFTGDVERYAQADLPPPSADILKVPHQGAATSDPVWLVAAQARLAVISVGANSYGHPSDEVIEALVGGGAAVRRTDRDGDVVVRLGTRP